MKLPKRDNRGKNSQAIYNRPSWNGSDRTRKRNSPQDDVRNEIGVDDETGTSYQSVKPSSTPARKKSKSTNGTNLKGGGKLKSKKRRKNKTKNCHVNDRSCSRVDVDVNLTAQAEQQSNGKHRLVFNFRP